MAAEPAPAAVPAETPTPPPIIPTSEPDTGSDFDVAAFLAENPPSEEEPTEPAPSAEGTTVDETVNEAEQAVLDALDEKPTKTEEGGDEPTEEETPVATTIDAKALQAAIDAKDPKAFLEALGDAAEAVLGTAAHRSLRLTHREIKQSQAKLVTAAEALKEKFGEPAAIREAAGKKDVDGVIAGVEKFFGTDWASFIKFVNAGLAGRPERLEAKAKEEREAAEARTKTEREAAEAQSARQAEAQVKLKTTIDGVVKQQQPALAGVPGIGDLVFAKLKAGFAKGVNTPAKALAAVVTDLRAQHAALSKAFGAPEKKVTKQAPPPRDTARKGREQTEDEFIAEFLRDNKP